MQTQGELSGHLAVLEALVLAVAEQCLAASIKDAGKLAAAYTAINAALMSRATEIEEAVREMRGASEAAWGYGQHLADELHARLAKRVSGFVRAPVEGNA
jgi:hypothetical protein